VPRPVQRGVPAARAAGSLPPPVLANSSLDKEESDGQWTTSDRWEPAAPPSPGVEGAAAELTLKASTEPPATGSSVEVPAGTTEVPVGTVEAAPKPSRKRKRGFSSFK
jgi:hypothetical protein